MVDVNSALKGESPELKTIFAIFSIPHDQTVGPTTSVTISVA